MQPLRNDPLYYFCPPVLICSVSRAVIVSDLCQCRRKWALILFSDRSLLVKMCPGCSVNSAEGHQPLTQDISALMTESLQDIKH